MNFKKSISLLFVLMMLTMGLIGCSSSTSAGEEKTFKIGHIRPEATGTDKDVQWFAEQIAEKTGNKVKFDIYPASQLGDYSVVQERVSMGDVEMQLAPVGPSLNKNMGITYMPYLVTNWEDALKYYGPDSEIAKAVDEMLQEENIKLLATYPKYFGGIALKEKPDNPADMSRKDIKIRVPGTKVFELTAKELGYSATPLPFAEAFTAMQTGIVDGVIGSGAEGYYANFRDLANYYLPLNDHFEMWYMYISNDTWENLTKEEQEIFQNTAKELAEKRFASAEQETEDYEQKLRDEGIEVIEYTDEELENFAKQVRENVWPELKKEYGEELFNRVTEGVQ
ncbi:TRAP transporter substrate-binding protein DctP [Halobacillus sp. MO56]